MKRRLGKLEKCYRARSCISKHVLDRLLRVIQMRDPLLIMVVRFTLQMQLGMGGLKSSRMVERYRLTGCYVGLAEKGKQQKDCEQSAHQGCNWQMRTWHNHNWTQIKSLREFP